MLMAAATGTGATTAPVVQVPFSGWGYGYGPWGWGHAYLGWPIGFFIFLVLAVLCISFVVRIVKHGGCHRGWNGHHHGHHHVHEPDDAMDILRRRLASGEIDEAAYQKLKEVLKD